MPYKICVHTGFHVKTKYIAQAVYEGCKTLGIDVDISHNVYQTPYADLFIAYGWKNQEIFSAYKDEGRHYIYIDIGYWGRECFSGDYNGFYKAIIDGRHPTGYFQRGRSSDRLGENSPTMRPWRVEERPYVTVAGMSEKGAVSVGLRYQEWEHNIIQKLQRITDKPIIYRPKPNRYSTGKPIHGTIFSPRHESIESVLEKTNTLFTYYSNVGVDALVAGVPIVVEDGVASVLSGDIEDQQYMPEGREQFMADLSYCQWRRTEIANGQMLRQFIDDGFILI